MRWFGRRHEARNAELDEEIRGHFRMAVEDRVARGESRSAAERAVRREFGNVLVVKEVTRAVWGGLLWEGLVQDARYAFRSLKRTPAFTTAAVLTLALGVGAITAVFTVVNGIVLRPLPFADPDRLVLVEHTPFLPNHGMSDRDYVALREDGTLFERVTTFSNQPIALTGAGEPARLNAGVVTTEFFDVLAVPPLLGRGFAAEEDEPGHDDVVVLGDALWRSRFAADSSVMGATVTIDGEPKIVLGVMPPGFDFPGGAELWMPLAMRLDPGNSVIRTVVGRLKRDATLEQSRAAFSGFVRRLPRDGDANDDVVSRVRPLKAYFTRNIQASLMMFAGAVAFVLLIACANVANLLLMRGASREREITVRTALGAGRGRVVRQLLTESVVIALLGGAAGAVLAYGGVQALLSLAPSGRLPRAESIRLDAAVLAFTLVASLISALAFGLLPSLYATRGDLRRALNIAGRTTLHDRGRARIVLGVAQIAVALVLLTGAGLMLRSFRNLRAVQLGFVPEHVLTLTVDLPPSMYETSAEMHGVHDRVLAGLSTLPAVSAAGAVNWLPLDRWVLSGDFAAEGVNDPELSYLADKVSVSPGYFRAMGVRLLRGRAFTASDGLNAAGVAIVSRSLAERIWPDGDIIGRRLAMTPEPEPEPEDWLTVVGVVDDVLQREITGDRSAAIYQPYTQVDWPFFLGHMTYVVRSTDDPQSIARAMRGVVRSADPNLPVHAVRRMNEVVASTTQEPLFQTWLLATFSMIALALAAIGVYGVLAYAVTQRRFEIGVRMALGARGSDVMASVLGRTLGLTLAGVLLGAVGAFAVTRALRRFLFEVTPTDPITFIGAAALISLAALLAAWLPARRAARVEPMAVLRSE
ncbi:MAG: ADOP family duplicated permease [Longimicrobiales bacterium]